MRLYLIRHADPDYAANTITPLGHLEAAALAEHFCKTAGFTHLYSSPLPRAHLTAEYIAKATSLPIHTEHWTTEIEHYRFPDRPPGYQMAWDMHGHEILAQMPPFSGEDWHARPPFNNPAFADHWRYIQSHSDAFLTRHGYRREGNAYRIDRPNRDRIALVCHKGFGLTWLAHLLGIPVPLAWSGFWIAPTGITTILFDERGDTYATPRCLHINDTAHLLKAGHAPNPHGIKGNFE